MQKAKNFIAGLTIVAFSLTLLLPIYVFAQQEEIKIPVLVYHYFYKDKEEAVKCNHSTVTSIGNFEAQMDYLYRKNFKTLTMEELYRFLKGEYTPPKNSVVITMDDGYKNNVTLAYPILKRYRFKACVFVIGKTLVDKSNKPDEFEYLNVEDMVRYSDVFEFGSHTYDMHKIINGRPALLQYSLLDILFDFINGQMVVQSPYFAYPFGGYNEEVIEILKSFNYKLAFTTKKGYVTSNSNPYELPRFTISDKTSFQQFVRIVEGRYFENYSEKKQKNYSKDQSSVSVNVNRRKSIPILRRS